jgi:hypothetical protein
MYSFNFLPVPHMSLCAYHLDVLPCYPKNIWQSQSTAVLIKQFSTSSSYFSPLVLNIFPNTLFLNTFHLCSSLNISDQVSHSYIATGLIMLSFDVFTAGVTQWMVFWVLLLRSVRGLFRQYKAYAASTFSVTDLVKVDEVMVGGSMSHTHTQVADRPNTFKLPYIMDTLLHITSASIWTKLKQHEDGDRAFPWNVVCK